MKQTQFNSSSNQVATNNTRITNMNNTAATTVSAVSAAMSITQQQPAGETACKSWNLSNLQLWLVFENKAG